MTERTHIPNSPACGQWETLLADALDGQLQPEDAVSFSGHMAACGACSALFEEAKRGREWLNFLSDEPEVPEGLVDRILAQTGPGNKPALLVVPGVGVAPMTVPAWQQPGFVAQMRRWAETRLMMTVAMAFFSIAFTLNLAGVDLTQARLSDLRPTAVRSYMERRINTASVPLVRYYDHLRLVNEVQSRVREFRNQNEESQPQPSTPATAPGESRRNEKNGGGWKTNPPQESAKPAIDPDIVETALGSQSKDRAFRRLQDVRGSEGSRVWIA